ncbi:MAG TPA: hypothetical protein VMY34_04960 [Acidimicrobiales bacterium]|nr:hypothetical protein [Acidimicrobiales bacterium]
MKKIAMTMVAAALFGALHAVPPASASNHVVLIDEVFTGTAEHPDAQFIEIRLYAAGQGKFQGTSIDMWNANGGSAGVFATFQLNGTNSRVGDRFVACTPKAAALFKLPCDAIATGTLPAGGGKIKFRPAPDVVTYGTYTGTSNPQPTVSASTISPGRSAQRVNASWSSATGFTFGSFVDAAPDPQTNLGLHGAL